MSLSQEARSRVAAGKVLEAIQELHGRLYEFAGVRRENNVERVYRLHDELRSIQDQFIQTLDPPTPAKEGTNGN